MFQRFLHIVQPTKWRERHINGVYGSKFIKSEESIVAIEDDGREEVYALTTTTGNYIVWGVMSSGDPVEPHQVADPDANA
jgi:hypothetical protein